jgi:hypothetical protein
VPREGDNPEVDSSLVASPPWKAALPSQDFFLKPSSGGATTSNLLFDGVTTSNDLSRGATPQDIIRIIFTGIPLSRPAAPSMAAMFLLVYLLHSDFVEQAVPKHHSKAKNRDESDDIEDEKLA